MKTTITRNPNLTKPLEIVNHPHEVKTFFKDSWWTGLPPEETPGFNFETRKLHALKQLDIYKASREEIFASFNNCWTLTDLLFSSLKTFETFIRPPYHELRHPMIFYYGHPAVLFVNKMRIAGLIKEAINPYLEKVLETGVDEMSWDDMSKNQMKWPSVEEVHDYKKKAYQQIIEVIKNVSLEKRGPDSPLWSLWMGIEHEKIHIETSSVLLREMPLEFLERPPFFPGLAPLKNETIKENDFLKMKGGLVALGKKDNDPHYGWDNEFGKREQVIKDFTYSRYQISNSEFLKFIQSGSYIQDEYWTEEGRLWRKFRNTKRPTFWCAVGPEGSHEYELRTIFEIIPMPWNAPVEVNHHEAKAYANWKTKTSSNLKYRLFTEFEFKRLDDVLCFELNKYNVDLRFSSAQEFVEEHRGNSWHHLEDQFNPLEDFKIHPYYDDFSTPCYDGKHQMIMGGSFISCGDEASLSARFHFRPHFYQHASFRLAATLDGSEDNFSYKIIKDEKYIHATRKNSLEQMAKEDWWKKTEQPLEFSTPELTQLIETSKKYLLDFMTCYSELHPGGEAFAHNNYSVPLQTSYEFPRNPENYDDLLKLIFKELAPLNEFPGHPRYAAYMAGSDNFLSNLAQLISQTLNPYSAHEKLAPSAVAIEKEALSWIINMVGYEEKLASAYFLSGSSMATMNAIMLARNEKGLHDLSLACAYVTKDTHHSFYKAWALLGFKNENIKILNEEELESDKKKGLIPLIIVATAGKTSTGEVDSLEDISKIASKNKIWFHVDAAYGGFFLLTQKGKELLKGIEKSDSVCLDPHKSLSMPYGLGVLVVKDVKKQKIQHLGNQTYMPEGLHENFDFSELTPELSRDWRGLRFWLPIKVLGITPFILNLEEKLKLADWFSDELSKIKGITIIRSPALTVFSFSAQNDEASKKLLEAINRSKKLFLSSDTIDSKFVLRVCLLGHRLHYKELYEALDFIKQVV